MTEHDIELAKQAYARAEKPQGEAVYQARIVGETKKGEWSDYCKEDYDKLLTVPHIAECRILYTTPPDQSAKIARLREALIKLRDFNWIISLPGGMDAVRQIAKQALKENT